MTQHEVFWIDAPEIQPKDQAKVCKQVYVWIVTKDKHIVIVSKDGRQWQFPGGKPEPGESLSETAVREVREETSIDISKLLEHLRFLGYQIVNDTESDERPYLQVRYILELNTEAATLELNVRNEDGLQTEKDMIRFVDTIGLRELPRRISWLADSSEFATVKALIIP